MAQIFTPATRKTQENKAQKQNSLKPPYHIVPCLRAAIFAEGAVVELLAGGGQALRREADKGGYVA